MGDNQDNPSQNTTAPHASQFLITACLWLKFSQKQYCIYHSERWPQSEMISQTTRLPR